MIEQIDSRLSSSGRLAAAITAADTTLALDVVPVHLASGVYRLRIDAEILTGVYRGTGNTFYELDRHLEGTSPAAHRASVVVHHPITGESLKALKRDAVAAALQAVGNSATGPDPLLYVKRPSERLFLASNFS